MTTIPPPEQPVEPWTIRTGDRVVFNGMSGTVTRAYLGDRREHELSLDGRPGRAYAREAELTRAPAPSCC